MPGLRRLSLLIMILLLIGLTVAVVVRAWGGQEVGPPIAICPGPDGYGYVCESGLTLQYIDATVDTLLYEDDDLVALDLPFTFTFYGTEYNRLLASSNGNLQFTTESTAFDNTCLYPQPAAEMGDMIAPYWDDLDLTFAGWLQSEVVGQAPDRVFVVEWDEVPRFGTNEDRVTFEVQLFEGSNDIVFLYEDVATIQGSAGSEATIGLQSEEQGYAIQVSCNQYAVSDGGIIRFVHPEQVEATAGLQYVPSRSEVSGDRSSAKNGKASLVIDALNGDGRSGLRNLQAAWLKSQPALASDWLWADLQGDGQPELVFSWYGDASRPELVELAIMGRGTDRHWRLLWQIYPLARQEQLRGLNLSASGDVTGDGAEEVILSDLERGRLLLLTVDRDKYQLIAAPGRCRGGLRLLDADGDGAMEILRGGCADGGRWTYSWDGHTLQVIGRSQR